MPISIRDLHPEFVGEVEGCDLRRPLSREETRRLEEGIHRSAVLVFHDQDIDDLQQVAFTTGFGPLENQRGVDVTPVEDLRLKTPVSDVSNLGQDNKPLPRDHRIRMFNLGNRLWHTDYSYRAIQAKYSILSGRVVVTEGGNTEFADMRAAYDALDAGTRAEIEDLICEHSLMYSRSKLGLTEFTPEEQVTFKPVRHRLVRTHPATGRKSLFLAAHIGTIVGWPVPEARALLQDLIEHATQPQFVHVHRWRPHDLIMWDNQRTMHRVRRFDETRVRDLRHTAVSGDAPTAPQAA